jgi:large subunit ribosomal protein L3
MPEVKRPRRGTLAFYPRKRARRIYPRIKSYPKVEKPKILAFAGYKAGCLHVIALDNRKDSPTFGQEISLPATILDCPPLKVLGIRAYEKNFKGKKVFTEAWCQNLPKDLERKLKAKPSEQNLEKIEKNLNRLEDIRLIVCTQPRLSGIGKKKPEVFEIGLGGEKVEEKYNFAKSLLGKEIKINEVFREGEIVDVVAVTKGKGTAGPVKRFGVKIQPRKAHQKLRHVGTLGQEEPGKVRFTVPMAGQLGFQTRSELNKRILKIGDGKEITPKGGIKRYGIIKSNYVLIEGSVPGSKKRLVMMRCVIRPGKYKFAPMEIRKVVI